MKKVKCISTFTFECDDKASFEEIAKCINSQILSDCNMYWQNDDDTAQMLKINTTIKEM